MENPWKTRQRKEVYSNPWIQVEEHQVINPSGNEGIYGVVHFKNLAVGIVPVDEHGFTWLVGQHRYPLNHYSWEIIEGGSPLGLSVLEGARRELKEETGLSAGTWHFLADVHTSNSVTDEHATLLVAFDLEYGEAAPDETEALSLKRLPLTEAFAMAHRGEITDAMSLVGLLRLEQCWSAKGFQAPARQPQWDALYPL